MPLRSLTTAMPRSRNSSAGPTPESCRSCGDCSAQAARRRRLVIADALLLLAVEIARVGNADAHAGGDEGFRHRMRLRQIADRERAAGAVPRIGAARLVLGFFEIGEEVRKTPARI